MKNDLTQSDELLLQFNTARMFLAEEEEEEEEEARIVVSLSDITDRKHAEEQIIGLNRIYAVLSNINQVIVRVHDIDRLFNDICRIAIEDGKFLMAWIGMVNTDSKKVEVVASAGFTSDYLAKINIDLNDEKRNQGPTGRTIISGSHFISNDIEHDENMIPWREDALKLGYRSSASFPIKVFGNVRNVFNMYSNEVGFFDEDEIKLLDELAMDISFALEFMEREAQRKRAEEALQENEERLRTIIETEPECVKVVDRDGQLLEMNAAGLAMLEAESLSEVQQHILFNFILPEYRASFETLHKRVMSGENGILEFEVMGLRGTRRWLETHAAPMRDAAGEVTKLLGVTRDITERKRFEESLKKQKDEFETIFNLVPAQIWYKDTHNNFIRVNRQVCTDIGMTNDKIEGHSAEELFPSFAQQYFKDDLEVFNARKPKLGISEQVNTANGEIRWVHTDKIPVFGNEGEVNGLIAFVQDITERKRAEEEISMLASSLRSINECVSITDMEDNLLFVNESFVKTYGYSEEELIGKKNMLIVRSPNNPPEVVREILPATLRGGWKGELLNRKKDGTEFPIFLSTTIIHDKEKKPLALIGVATDITERKRAEESLKESEQRLRIIAETTNAVLYRLKYSDDMKYDYINPAIENLTGYNPDEINKIGFASLVEKIEGTGGEELKSEELKSNREKLVYEFRADYLIRTKQGDFKWLADRSYPWFDENGTLIGSLGILTDITQRKESEQEIVSQKNRFAQLFENSPIAIALLDAQDKVVFINESFSALYGYYLEEVKGKPLNDLIVPPGLKEEAKSYSDQTRAGNQINKESYRRKKDGTPVCVQIIGVPVTVNDRTVGVYGMYVDLTQRKKAEEELIIAKEKAEEMSRLKSNFLNNMSHELRTPLNGILGYADILTSLLDKPDQNEMAQGIYQSGRRLSETLNFILDLSEAETNKIEVIAKDISIVPLVKNSIHSFSNEAAKKKLQFETIIKEENIFAHLDEHLFNRILYNLIDNAFKFTKKGKISVEIGKELIDEKDPGYAGAGWFYVKVKDTGIGIAPDKIDLIWDEFRQVSEGLSRSYEGTGLGLTIAKKAVELMQGVISVESELGVGSLFTVKFPAISVLPQKEELVQEKQTAVIQPGKEKVDTAALPLALYVEDDFVNSHVVTLFLKDTCVVETAEDGKTALQLITDKKFDVILVDINLGAGMNGMEVVKEIIKMPQYAGTPIIAVTAYAMGKDKAEFLKGGCTNYISKPFKKEELIKLVRSVTSSRQR